MRISLGAMDRRPDCSMYSTLLGLNDVDSLIGKSSGLWCFHFEFRGSSQVIMRKSGAGNLTRIAGLQGVCPDDVDNK